MDWIEYEQYGHQKIGDYENYEFQLLGDADKDSELENDVSQFQVQNLEVLERNHEVFLTMEALHVDFEQKLYTEMRIPAGMIEDIDSYHFKNSAQYYMLQNLAEHVKHIRSKGY